MASFFFGHSFHIVHIYTYLQAKKRKECKGNYILSNAFSLSFSRPLNFNRFHSNQNLCERWNMLTLFSMKISTWNIDIDWMEKKDLFCIQTQTNIKNELTKSHMYEKWIDGSKLNKTIDFCGINLFRRQFSKIWIFFFVIENFKASRTIVI